VNKGARELEDWEARMMRRYREGGWSHAELSFFFDVSQPVVSRVCRGQSYRDAGGPVETERIHRNNAP
jgi:hypothetical protein